MLRPGALLVLGTAVVCATAACGSTTPAADSGLVTDSSGALVTPVAAEDALAVVESAYQPVEPSRGSGYTTCSDPTAETPGPCPFTARLQATVDALTPLAPGCPSQPVNPVKPDSVAFSGPDTMSFTVTSTSQTGANIVASDSGPPSPTPWTFTIKLLSAGGKLLIDDIEITPPSGIGQAPYDIYDSHVNCH